LTTLRLDWQKIFQVRRQHSLQEVLDVYSEVFTDTLGTVKGVSAKIYVEETAIPNFTRPDRYLSHSERRWRKSSNASSGGE
jgi:hypothetical protein